MKTCLHALMTHRAIKEWFVSIETVISHSSVLELFYHNECVSE